MGGFELVNADCILIGERPRIADVRVAMGARLAGAMGVDIDRVTVRRRRPTASASPAAPRAWPPRRSPF